MCSRKLLEIILLLLVLSDLLQGEALSLEKQLGEAPPAFTSGVRTPRNRRKRSNDGSECKRVCSPVCGENGMTYCNQCHAECLRIQLKDVESGCKTWFSPVDDVCANCPSDYEPVCACDRVYYNSCVANCMDIWIYQSGLCW